GNPPPTALVQALPKTAGCRRRRSCVAMGSRCEVDDKPAGPSAPPTPRSPEWTKTSPASTESRRGSSRSERRKPPAYKRHRGRNWEYATRRTPESVPKPPAYTHCPSTTPRTAVAKTNPSLPPPYIHPAAIAPPRLTL